MCVNEAISLYVSGATLLMQEMVNTYKKYVYR